jgi:hypothetical protein
MANINDAIPLQEFFSEILKYANPRLKSYRCIRPHKDYFVEIPCKGNLYQVKEEVRIILPNGIPILLAEGGKICTKMLEHDVQRFCGCPIEEGIAVGQHQHEMFTYCDVREEIRKMFHNLPEVRAYIEGRHPLSKKR